MREPTISICFCCYNVEDYIETTLNSLIGERILPLEILCLDDCSTDSTTDILRRFEKDCPCIRVIRNEENHNLLYSRKRVLSYASGDYVIMADGDDSFRPHAVENMQKELKKYGYPDILEYQCRVIYSKGKEKKQLKTALKHIKEDLFHRNYCQLHEGELRQDNLLRAVISDEVGQMVWNKLIRRELLTESYSHCLSDHFYYKEDVYLCSFLYDRDVRYAGTGKRFYNYSFNTGKSHRMFTLTDFHEKCRTGEIICAMLIYLRNGCLHPDLYPELIKIKCRVWIRDIRSSAGSLQLSETETLESISKYYHFDEFRAAFPELIAELEKIRDGKPVSE